MQQRSMVGIALVFNLVGAAVIMLLGIPRSIVRSMIDPRFANIIIQNRPIIVGLGISGFVISSFILVRVATGPIHALLGQGIPLRRLYNAVVERPLQLLKIHWRLTLIIAVACFLGSIILIERNYSETVLTAVIIIVPASIYYLYSEFLNKPSVRIAQAADERFSLIPTVLPRAGYKQLKNQEPTATEEGFQPVINNVDRNHIVRPVLLHRLAVTNHGKQTAQNALVQVRISGAISELVCTACWEEQGNSQTYSLRPGERAQVSFLKVYLTQHFFPAESILRIEPDDADVDLDNVWHDFDASAVTGPRGSVKPSPNIETEDIDPKLFLPGNLQAMEPESNIGEWPDVAHQELWAEDTVEYVIEARLLGDNYRSSWQHVETLTIPDEIYTAAQNSSNWTAQWRTDMFSPLRDQLRAAIRDGGGR